AGRPIKAVVRIYDANDSLVRGAFTSAANGASYHDTLGRGGLSRPLPFLLVNPGDTLWLSQSPWDASTQTFSGGTDTVTFFLYNADTNNVHQLYMLLATGTATIPGKSDKFKLLPDTMASIVLETPSGDKIKDSVFLAYPNDVLNAYGRGYDIYGNPVGEILSNWTVSPGLHRIPDSVNKPSIFYSASDVSKDEEGYIKVSHNGFTDSVKVTIRGPAIQMKESTTQDLDGDGLLDHMVLHFSRPIVLSESYAKDSIKISMKVYPDVYVFKVDSLEGTPGVADSVWVIALHDTLFNNLPQTAWKPTVVLQPQKTLNLADTVITSTDGAGPVVWTVEKRLVGLETRNEDVVTVTYSEPITKSNTNLLTVSDDPAKIFTVWTKDPSDTTKFIKVPTMLKNIAGAGVTIREIKDNQIIFTMSNGEDLTSQYFFSFDTTGGGYVADMASEVTPAPGNRLERVKVVGDPGAVIVIGPNPMLPTVRRKPSGVLDVRNEPEASKWVTQDRSGAVMKFDFKAPTYQDARNGGVKVRVAIKIYDLAGNLVQSSKNDDFAPGETNSITKATVYWNGTNGRGMAAAPGVYRVVAFVNYWDNGSGASRSYTDTKHITKVGVGR
ncbi:MAG: hypothetical protein MUF22_03885, partial [Chitinispirillaceae bacterium]|nr:hypothetical protein [Chitinispirillaceae bacterium]